MQITTLNIPNQQKGAVLITALVFLLILTILAVTSMTTNTLEEKMAANSQEINRAFQTAETGVEIAMSDEAAFSTANTKESDGTAGDPYPEKTMSGIGSYGATATYNAIYRQQTRPPRGSKWDSSFSMYHFDLSATGRTATGATTTIHAGAYQIGPDT